MIKKDKGFRDKTGIKWRKKFSIIPRHIGDYWVWFDYYYVSEWYWKNIKKDFIQITKINKPQ